MREKLIAMIQEHKKKYGQNDYRFALDAGLAPATLLRLIRGKACNMSTAERIMEYLNLEIVKKKG